MANSDAENQGLDSESYFENYRIQSGDLETLRSDVDELAEAKLLEEGILDEICFVTYDSTHLYVFTQGQHASNERFEVEELPTSSTKGFRLFKMPHSGSFGRDRKDYRGAYAGVSHETYEQLKATAVGLGEFIEAVSIPPFGPYEKIKKKDCNYKTDMVFHEAGHIEHYRLQSSKAGEDDTLGFPSEAQKERFIALVRNTQLFPPGIADLIPPHISQRAIQEMYAMIIDREGAKRFDPVRYNAVSTKYEVIRKQLSSDEPHPEALKDFKQHLQEWEHYTGQVLVLILEEQFPDFRARKKFVRDCLDPKQQP